MTTCELHRKVSTLAALIGSLAVGAPAQVWEVDNTIFWAGGQPSSHFGAAIAIGDFQGDGRLDIAIGDPDFDTALDEIDAGRVSIWRNNGGKSFAFEKSLLGWNGDRFGAALAAGDFDGDGLDELAIGSPKHDGATCAVGSPPCIQSGLVSIYERVDGIWTWAKDFNEVGSGENGPEPYDHFGTTLAVGDFDDDGIDDLAVAGPDDDMGAGGTYSNAGKVCVYYRPLPSALSWDQYFVDAAYLDGTLSDLDRLGSALAAGDFDGNGVDDLAMGAPGRDIGGDTSAGEVHVVHGLDGSGLTLTGQGLLSYASFGQAPSEDDRFGAALAAANFDQTPFFCLMSGPCQDDLAIGVPGDDRLLAPGMVVEQVGRVLVSYGSPSGLALDGSTLLSQIGLSESAEELDRFGTSLAAGRLRGTGGLSNWPPADLVIGVPDEDLDGLADLGYIHVAFGSGSGVALGDPAEQPLPHRQGYMSGPPAAGDSWGDVLAIADFDADGYGDLLVGMPTNDHPETDSGVVLLLYGAMYADGFEIGSTVNWSSTVTP